MRRMSLTIMGRDSSKTEEIRIYCSPELKRRWVQWAVFFKDHPAALDALLLIQEENPELVDLYAVA